VKYGILFVALTFGGFFIFELMKELSIHPIQYLLVGFGLAIFFLLLVSFSEHMVFGIAYLIASIACICLLTFYVSYVLRSAERGLGFGALLTSFYAAIYGLLLSEDNARILGSLMVFVLLAVVMFVARNVDWYKAVTGKLQQNQNPPPPLPSSAEEHHENVAGKLCRAANIFGFGKSIPYGRYRMPSAFIQRFNA
jgi:inner membrane protein